jgi:hypothetical protein
VSEDSTPLRTYAVVVAIGVLALLAVSQARWHSGQWHRISIRGPEADHIALNTIASEIARHPVTVSCVLGLFESGEAGQALPGGNVATLDKRVCIDLGHFGSETPSSIACAESDPHGLCPGTINQELDAKECRPGGRLDLRPETPGWPD